jgi:hypothetical protein
MDSNLANPLGTQARPELFVPCGRPDEQLHPDFRTLRDSPLFAPARDVLRDLEHVLGKPDAELVEEFQTVGFDACMFDIYLSAMFAAAGHEVDASHRRPRLVVSKTGHSAAVDSVTAGGGAESPLLHKLLGRAWALAHVASKPYVIAVQDPHASAHSAPSSPTLSRFLASNGHGWYVDLAGRLVEAPARPDAGDPRSSHLPAGFFEQPGADDVSAILLCGDNGRISKFNRVGQESGHRCDAVRMLRYGTCRRCEGGPASAAGFVYEVGAHDTGPETWGEGTVLIHNPHARRPLRRGWIGSAAEMEPASGQMACTFGAGFHALTSVTEVLPGNTPSWWIQERAHLIEKEFAAHRP